MDTPGGKFFTGVLPQQFAVGFPETQEAAQVYFVGVALEVTGAVIGSHIDTSIRNHRIAVSLATDTGHPFNIACFVTLPVFRSNFPTAQSVGMSLPNGVLLR